MPAGEGPSGKDLEALTTLWRERGVSITALGERGSQSLEASDRALTSGLTEQAGHLALEPLTEAALAHEPFEIGELLGRGGMGMVHRATQVSLRREVAIKRVAQSPRGSAHPAALAALLKEAWVGGNLEHPNVVPVHALVEIDGAPAVVMKRIEGTSLQAALRDPTLLPASNDPLAFQVRVLVAACNAIAYAHRRGVLHLDLKPDNVMLGRFGEVCVLDWGLAAGFGREAPRWLPAAAEIHAVSGTPDYMAPEIAMADGARISPRTDVYLLGAMLHEVVTGVAPHPGATLLERLEHAYRSAPYPYPETVSEELAAILHTSMHRDPERRFATAEALRDALESFLGHRRGDEMLREAAGRIGLLEAALEARADEVRVSHLFGAARFALREATEVRKTAESAALRGRLFGGMARHAMDAGRLALAESYLREIEGHADLRQRLADLFRRAEAETARVHELEHLAHDEDLRLGSQFRRRVTVGWGLVFLAGNVAYAALERFSILSMGYREMMTQSLGVLVAVGAYTLFRRGALFQNRANASVFSVAIITYFLLQAFWVAALWLGIPFRSALALSGMFYLLAGGAVSVMISPRFALSPVVAALGLLGGALRPDLAWWMLGVFGGLALAVVGLSWRDATEEARP
ncbi:MAG: serine/threonine protein kinase [Myxococcales bacterium]|nr:serine/threonine protein kinase [Myxococcales bacterium]